MWCRRGAPLALACIFLSSLLSGQETELVVTGVEIIVPKHREHMFWKAGLLGPGTKGMYPTGTHPGLKAGTAGYDELRPHNGMPMRFAELGRPRLCRRGPSVS